MYAATLATGLVAAGLVSLSVARPWESASASVRGFAAIDVSVSGADLAPLSSALGFVLLAAFGAVVATRGRWRRGIGAAIAVAAIVVLISVGWPGDAGAIESALAAKGWAGGDYDTWWTAWRWLSGLGALGALGAGLAVAAYGHLWATMGTRYTAPTAADDAPPPDQPNAQTEADVWRAIDHGYDPTQTP